MSGVVRNSQRGKGEAIGDLELNAVGTRRSAAKASGAGRLLQIFNKNKVFLCIFRPSWLFLKQQLIN